MKQFLRVMRFSFYSQIKNKGLIISTILICVIIAGGMSVPSIINMFSKDKTEAAGPNTTEQAEKENENAQNIIIVSDPARAGFKDISEFQNEFPNYVWKLENAGQSELSEMVENEDIFAALIVNNDMDFTYIHKNDINALGKDISSQISRFLVDRHRYNLLLSYNVSDEDAGKFFVSPKLNDINVGLQNIVGQSQSFVFILLLYMTILTCGSLVSTSIVQEKSSRAMEILITTSRPETLMFGKVIGIGLAGLCQMFVFLLTGVVFYFVNQTSLVSVEILGEMFKIPVSTFIYAFVFYIGGFFFYAMMFGSLGSLVSRMEDLSSSNAPITLFTVLGFLVAIYGQLYGFAGSLFYKVCSYVPFTSPYVMLARVCGETNVPVWEVVVSIVILYISTGLMGILSAKIYRIGVLMYGKRPSLKDLAAALRQS